MTAETRSPCSREVGKRTDQEKCGCHEPTGDSVVALDVHQATLVVSVRDAQPAVVLRATIATEAKAKIAAQRPGETRTRHRK